MSGQFTTRREVKALYKKRARHYDFTANLYYLIGFRERHFRKLAVDRLDLGTGDIVVEIGCGTGLNFRLLQEKVGERGRIIGVDLSPEMLALAKERTERNEWSNVSLVESAAASYKFPRRLDGILSTFALTLEPEYDAVIQEGGRALKPGKRFVVADLKLPESWLRFLTPVIIPLVKPFGASRAVAERKPWESMEKHLKMISFETRYFDMVYIAVGQPKAS